MILVTGQRRESGANDRISMGAKCLPGRVVFRVSRIVKVIPVVVSCIHEVSSLECSLHRKIQRRNCVSMADVLDR